LLKAEQKAALAVAMKRLPERNRAVLEAYYFENRTLEDIGAQFGLSKSWTSRIHAKGIELLRELMTVRATSGALGR
jgi:RNA polymerase sigma factor for flagellar operon FliA